MVDINNDGKIDFQDRLLGVAAVQMCDNEEEAQKISRNIQMNDTVFFNQAIVVTWPLFSLYLFTQPWMANWTNNSWHQYSATYDVYGDDGALVGEYVRRRGLCNVPAAEMHCTDGQNFTELALKHRGAAIGCGCGEGIYGEGLCPMTSYGYTLSDYVSTAPSLGAMLGLGFFPLLGTWQCTLAINKHCRPTPVWEKMHFWTMLFFQISYIAWGMASDCVFPLAHAVLTVAFLGGFLAHWVVSAFLCIAAEGVTVLEADIILYVAMTSISVITVGALPRVFLTINGIVGYGLLPNWNRGIGAYAFWFAEVAGLSLTFGAYPLILLGYHFKECLGLTKTGEKPSAYALTKRSLNYKRSLT